MSKNRKNTIKIENFLRYFLFESESKEAKRKFGIFRVHKCLGDNREQCQGVLVQVGQLELGKKAGEGL